MLAESLQAEQAPIEHKGQPPVSLTFEYKLSYDAPIEIPFFSRLFGLSPSVSDRARFTG